MSLPPLVREAVEARLGSVIELGPVGGGCINPAVHIHAGDSELFLKYGRRTPEGFFATEAQDLRQLRAATSRLRVPEVVAYADADAESPYGWIVMEWLEPGRPGRDFAHRLAEGLCELHTPLEGGWGAEWNGYIGTLAQDNTPTESWSDFWQRRRLAPQLELARRNGWVPGGDDGWERLFERLPRLLAPAEVDGPSLLHGDLWGGNILATASGEPAIVDPAPYRGHREVDLAMSELFGGPTRTFYEEYDRRRPLLPGYREHRRAIYQLYYLLVHVNLFGDAYVARTAASLNAVLAST